MIVLITKEELWKGEADVLNDLMKNNTVVLHLRKPFADAVSCSSLLSQLNESVLQRVVIHQHFSLVDSFELKGIHLNETIRKHASFQSDNIVSSSFHSTEDFKNEIFSYEYGFCSPVFKSLSKENYFPREKWEMYNMDESVRKKAVALGGVESKRFVELREMGFQHIALLGAVWNEKNAKKALVKLVHEWENLDRM